MWIKTLRDGVRHTERMFKESEARGGTANKMADCAYHYSGAAVTQVTASWLANRFVVGWADGAPLDTVRADSSGNIPLLRDGVNIEATEVTVGFGYTARRKSVKLAFGSRNGSAIGVPKQIGPLMLSAADICTDGVRAGIEIGDSGAITAKRSVIPIQPIRGYYNYGAGHVFRELDAMLDVQSDTDRDPRIVVEAVAPYPATIIGLGPTVDTHDD